MKKYISFLLCFILCFNLMSVMTLAEGEPSTYTITVSVEGNGHFMYGGFSETNRVIEVPAGSNNTFDIVAEEGYEVEEVFVNGSSVGFEFSWEFSSIAANQTLHAKFVPDRYPIYFTDWQNGEIRHIVGDIPSDGYFDGGVNVIRGGTASFSIAPSQGYILDEFLIDNVAIDDYIDMYDTDGYYAYEITGVTTSHSIYATFTPLTYTINTSVEDNEGAVGVGGVISPASLTDVPYDETRTFNITPDPGYRVKEILDNGESRGANNTYELSNIRENHNIEVVFEPIGTGEIRTITTQVVGNGDISADEMVNGEVEVGDGFDKDFIITPEPGYKISEILILPETMPSFDITGRNTIYNGDGSFTYTLKEVFDDMTLRVTLAEQELSELTDRSYAVLQENSAEPLDSEDIKAALAYEMGFIGYAVPTANIAVSDINTDTDTLGCGTFKFTVTIGDETSPEATGYIVPAFDNIVFKTTSNGVEEIRIADSDDFMSDAFGLPAMNSGYIEVFGIHGARIEGFMSPDVDDAIDFINSYKVQVLSPFYRADFHIGNMVGEEGPVPTHPEQLNWFGFTTIQDDAFCVKVDATSEKGTQGTLQWDLNRYAVLNSGSYVSEVFFGNDTFEISIPEAGIGGASTISVETGDFQGYTVTETVPDERYEIFFKSDFYDRITLDVTMNGDEVKQLTIHRVGVQIQKEVYIEDRGNPVSLFHGTQFSTNIDFLDGQQQYYRIYATYCIPDRGIVAPYGLYVIYTYANGTKESRVITAPCDDPSQMRNAENYENGVFIYGQDPDNPDTACCDYLLYSAEDDTNAPVKINVTVLKGNPLTAGTFGGIFFGSGAGVEWINE